ncbi:V8-like Glu-specific endopeptidase [Aeromonas hydrophila]|nr:V8-like Glu-specific endopeptidase [Aeromonas hydrophila]
MKNSFQAKIEYPDTKLLDRACKWGCPEFQPIDGIGEEDLWTLQGLIVAIGFIDNEANNVIGSGIMIAPGLCLTATHVIEETKQKHALLYSFPNKENIRIWAPEDFHAQKKISVEALPFQKSEPRYSDVGILSYSPFSKFSDNNEYLFSPIEVSIPKVGERVWGCGYREVFNDGAPTIAFYVTSGIVTEHYLEGRGSHINGPCIEVAMQALGGMSGGPVFNTYGRIIGVISSCLEGQQDNMGPTYVSLVWTSLLSNIYTPWPQSHWPENIGGIQVAAEYGTRLLGSARFDEHGSYRVTFHKENEEFMLDILQTAGIDTLLFDDDLSWFVYDRFEKYLEEEGLKYLVSMNKSVFNKSLIDKHYTETIQLLECYDVDVMEGLEDIHVQSMTLLDNGNVGVDVLYDIRIAILLLKILKVEYEYHKEAITSLSSLTNTHEDEDFIYFEHCARPFYRASFTYEINNEECHGIRFQFVSMKI